MSPTPAVPASTTATPTVGGSATSLLPQGVGSYVTVNNLSMYYEVHGSSNGVPLVLLHGGGQTIDLAFEALLPPLARDHQVIALELQGHGRTADIEREPSFAGFAEDVVALLDHLDVERANVFGFSTGGLVATELAISHPERLGRVVLASAHFRADGYHPEIHAPEQDSPRLPTEDDFAAMQQAYTAVAPDPDHFLPFMQRLQRVVHDFRGWSDEQLRSLTTPALLVVGDTDFVRLEHAVAIHALLADARLAVLPDCTHMDVVRRANQLLPLIDAFLSATPAA